MSISPIFMFAPVPLSERSPLAHAAEIARRRMAETQALASAGIRPRTKSSSQVTQFEKRAVEPAAA
jgi:hypothetical protein